MKEVFVVDITFNGYSHNRRVRDTDRRNFDTYRDAYDEFQRMCTLRPVYSSNTMFETWDCTIELCKITPDIYITLNEQKFNGGK